MVQLGNETYEANQKQLRDWLALEEIKISLSEAVGHKDGENVADNLCLYVSTAFGLDKDKIEELPWNEVALAFDESCTKNRMDLSHIAFIRGEAKDKKELWDYFGRTWWIWAHTLAKEFGWEIEYIANMNVLDAFSLIQEIFLEEQFEREWEWTLSEYSTKYNSATKKSDPNPLPRPSWMKITLEKAIEPPEKMKIKKEMLPVGNIIRYTEH